MSIILASGSLARRRMLASAGVTFEISVADIDEAAARVALAANGSSAEAAAKELARLKAATVSEENPGALVIGADQILEHREMWLEKPGDRSAAAAQLVGLRGDVHRLVSAAVVLHNGRELWHCADSAELRMRDFSDAFLASYLDSAGQDILGSVGAYQLEGLGAQLFSAVRGDFFTILGLPLLPLLDFLREKGELPL